MADFVSANYTAKQLNDIIARMIELGGKYAPDRFLTKELILCEAPRPVGTEPSANGQTGLRLTDSTGNRFQDTMEYSRTVAELVETGKYDRIDHGIFEPDDYDNPPEAVASLEVEEVVFHLSGESSFADIVERMRQAGLRQVSRKEILNFGWRHPDVQRGFPLVALGCHIQIKDSVYGICLRGDNTSRAIGLCNRDQKWPACYRILGIVVPSTPV
jgi:hypothetical protein